MSLKFYFKPDSQHSYLIKFYFSVHHNIKYLPVRKSGTRNSTLTIRPINICKIRARVAKRGLPKLCPNFYLG